jgi:hypothetical protein
VIVGAADPISSKSVSDVGVHTVLEVDTQLALDTHMFPLPSIATHTESSLCCRSTHRAGRAKSWGGSYR